ncbi:MAG: phosphopyruvate hydratase [Candidatus Woesearchaeota archaeon]
MLKSILITKINARQVLDSRGNPTIEVDVFSDLSMGRAIVPSGASTGKFEAIELRDGKKDYGGKSVINAVNNVNDVLSGKLLGVELVNQKLIDDYLINVDGTKNKSRIGANAILGVSLAASRCAANSLGIPLYKYLNNLYNNSCIYNKEYNERNFLLPIPFANVINGGKHAGSDLMLQEFMIVPIKARSFDEATRQIVETYHILKNTIIQKYGKTASNVGDEGGFAPPLKNPEEALDLLTESIKSAGYKGKIKIAIDCAASEYYKNNVYYPIKDLQKNGNEIIAYYESLKKNYDIISIEDPFEQEDYESFANFFSRNKKFQIVGDDLLVTNPEKISTAISKKLCNTLLLKVNQIGSLSEAFNAARIAQSNKWKVMVSHRSGETEDSFIADLSVALNCGQIKLGAPCRGERTAKYNQLLRIEEELGKNAKMNRF